MNDDDLLGFNFWTAFADIMLSFVLILCLLLFVNLVIDRIGELNLTDVKNNQAKTVNSIAEKYKTAAVAISDDSYGISTRNDRNYDIKIKNDLDKQTIIFTDQLLFKEKGTEMDESGKQVLRNVGEIISEQLYLFKEIQIQGHADSKPTNPSNTILASKRAVTVLEFLKDENEVGIDPYSNLMSATSFGEFKPVQRSDENANYTKVDLDEHNKDDKLRSQNRRIEMVLIYRR